MQVINCEEYDMYIYLYRGPCIASSLSYSISQQTVKKGPSCLSLVLDSIKIKLDQLEVS